jgi:predicted transposase YdaD
VTEILFGLRYPRELTEVIMSKVMNMLDLQESHAYQIIHRRGEVKGEAKGKIEGIRDTLLRVGRKKLGKPSVKVLRDLNAITDELRLTELSERILDVATWKELLTPK